MNLLIIIPSYNSNDTLLELIANLNDRHTLSILVIDDGSDVEFSSDIQNVKILRNRKNRGKGYSLLKGFQYASSNGYSHALTMDADLQHSYMEVSSFLSIDTSVDLVLGCRERRRKMPISRRFSNKITSLLISSLVGMKITDSQCGYRRYNLDLVLEKNYLESGFQFESEVLIKCISRSLRVEQIKIETIYDPNNKSYIRHMSDTLKFIRLIIRSIIRK